MTARALAFPGALAMTMPIAPRSPSPRTVAATFAVVIITGATVGGLLAVSRRGGRAEEGALGLVRFRLDHAGVAGAVPTAFPAPEAAPLVRGALRPLVASGREAPEEADPFAVAGHALDEAPVAGEPRVVALAPSDTDALSTQPTLEVLFDQAIDLTQAQRLIELSHPGELVPVTLSHPAKGAFEGHEVDARWVVHVTPQQPLRGKTGYKLVARDAKPKTSGDAERQLTFDVAGPLELRAIECGKDCLLGPSRVLLSSSALVLAFSHRVEASPLPRVVVSPPVPDLQVSVVGRRVTVTGSFAPSSTHRLELAGLRDALGQSLPAPVRLTLQRNPLDASIAQPEGLLTLNQAELARIALPTRNVAEVLVSAYEIDVHDPAKLRAAMDAVRSRALPEGEPTVSKVLTVAARRDQMVDLPLGLDRLLGSKAHLVTTRITKAAFGAASPTDAGDEDASELTKPTLALVVPATTDALAAHVHRMNDRTLVHVAQLATGDLVSGATVSVSARETLSGRTDASGVAVLAGEVLDDDVLQVVHQGRTLLVPAHETSTADGLFPHLSTKLGEAGVEARRSYVFTERGVYRPGDTVHVKGTVRLPQGGRLAPVPKALVAAVLLDASHKEVARQSVTTSDTGGFDLALGTDDRVGHRSLEVRDGDAVLASTSFLVAETETPRFLVDVENPHMEEGTFVAQVRARYPFGTALAEGSVHFSLRRSLPGRYFDENAEYTFSSKLDERTRKQEIAFTQAGDGKLGEGGTFAVRVKVPKAAVTTSLELEADVSDASERHVAGSGKTLAHVAKTYAGLELVKPWGTVGDPFAVRGLVADPTGKILADQETVLRLVRLRYHVTAQRVAHGSRTEWSAERIPEVGPGARCATRNGETCMLVAQRPGEYLVVASHGGRDAGEARVYFAPKSGEGTSVDEATTRPVEGRTMDLVADKPSYRAGEVAHVAIRAPFSQGHALVTLDQGAHVSHRTLDLSGPLTVLDVPVDATLAPWVNLTVTAFGRGADYRIGALRLRVRGEDAELTVAAKVSGDRHAPGAKVPVRIEVRREGPGHAPAAHAEVTVAVVDEAVHRLGGDEDPTPAAWLHQGAPLAFAVSDSRDGLGAWLKQSHVAGDGSEGGEGDASPLEPPSSKRKDATVLYLPSLFTGDDGTVSFDFPAPERLSEYRITATAIDLDGRAGATHHAVVVDKPLKMIPVVPRFLSLGDRAEVAVTVHNDADQDAPVQVRLGDAVVVRLVPKRGQELVRIPITPAATGPMELRFRLETPAGAAIDRAEVSVPVTLPASLERPEISGTFQGTHTLQLDVPAYAAADPQGEITVQVGENLWPELGGAVDALLDYPHGCLEQTTSSTLPLLAAQIILPRTGTRHADGADLAKMIEAGIARLSLMRTTDGGLAYWPGDTSAHVYGTAYAFLALDRAARNKVPKAEPLRDAVAEFLRARLERGVDSVDTLAFMAASLSSAGLLDPARLPALWDRRVAMSAFGRAHLALATLRDRRDQAETLADELEAEVLRGTDLVGGNEREQWETFGSPARDAAAVLRALSRLKPSSDANRVLGARVLRSLAHGTTQEAAFGLLALSEIVSASRAVTGDTRVFLANEEVTPTRSLGAGIVELRLPLARVAGHPSTLRFESSGLSPSAFAVRGRYRRPVNVAAGVGAGPSVDTGAAWHLAHGPNVFRMYSDAKGKPVDLAAVPLGSLVRVAVLVDFPADSADSVPDDRLRYLAVTDRLPAGFEPVDPDLRTVASVPGLGSEHPFAAILKGGGSASHIELRSDRVHVYFDDRGQRASAATYVMRATTRGTFVAAPAEAELMYEPQSLGRSEAVSVTVQ